ncbi:MAG: ATP-binding protein, partial [Spirochaetota bacterium]
MPQRGNTFFKTARRTFPVVCILLFIAAVFLAFPSLFAKPVELTEKEKTWLMHNPDKLTVWYDWKFPPIEYTADDGTFRGMGADMMHIIENRLGVKFTMIDTRSWEHQLSSLKSGEAPIVPVIVDTPERRNFAYFTKPFLDIPVVIITSRRIKGTLSLDDLKGKKVAVVSGYATQKYLESRSQNRFTIIPVKNVQDGLRDLSFGDIDAFVENLAVAAYYIDKEGLSNLRVAGNTDFSFRLSIAVSREYPLLFSAVNKAFMSITQEEMDSIHSRWIKLETPGMLSEEMMIVIKLTAVFTVILLFSLSLLSWFLKRKLGKEMFFLREARESLKKSNALANAIMDQSFNFLGLLDTEGRIIRANKKILSFSDITMDQIRGKLFWETPCWKNDPDAEAFLTQAISEAKEGRVARKEVTLSSSDGSRLIMDFTMSPFIDESGKIQYVIPEARDISGIRKAEEEKLRLREQLIQSQKMDALGQLAGGIAHDFNNMLGAITGAADLLASRCADNEEAAQYCQIILTSSERAGQLAGKLLAFSRKGKTQSTPVDIHIIISETITILERSIDRRISVKAELLSPVYTVIGDPGQLQNAVLNLGLNARDAMPEGGTITFRTEMKEINEYDSRSSAFPIEPGLFIRIHVIDTGKGIPDSIIGRIFEPFFTTKPPGKGTGLGLAAVYGTVLDHKGSISVTSAVGKGTEFVIDLPSAEITPEKAAEERTVHRGSGIILLVEDEEILRSTGSMLLEDLGYTPVCAANGREGLDYFTIHHAELSAVICDMVMPVMSGPDALREMRKIDPSVPL